VRGAAWNVFLDNSAFTLRFSSPAFVADRTGLTTALIPPRRTGRVTCGCWEHLLPLFASGEGMDLALGLPLTVFWTYAFCGAPATCWDHLPVLLFPTACFAAARFHRICGWRMHSTFTAACSVQRGAAAAGWPRLSPMVLPSARVAAATTLAACYDTTPPRNTTP